MMTPPLGPQTIDLALRLLDRQLIDVDGQLVGKVDDVELIETADGWQVDAFLLGPAALGARVGGRWGATMIGLHRRLRGTDEGVPPRIAFRHVARIDSAIELAVSARELDINASESWVYEHLIRRIPGGRRAGQ